LACILDLQVKVGVKAAIGLYQSPVLHGSHGGVDVVNRIPYNLIEAWGYNFRFEVFSLTPSATDVNQFTPIHDWRWLSDTNDPRSGLHGCTYLQTFGVKMPNKKSGSCGSTNARLDPSVFEASGLDPYGQPPTDTVDIRHGTSSVYGIEFWNTATATSYIDSTCTPAGSTTESYGSVAGNKLLDASKISMVFALDYTSLKANLEYI